MEERLITPPPAPMGSPLYAAQEEREPAKVTDNASRTSMVNVRDGLIK